MLLRRRLLFASALAGLGASRTSQMRDVLTTLQADQDAIIRADSRGPLVVDGGPGTGKTVVFASFPRALRMARKTNRISTTTSE